MIFPSKRRNLRRIRSLARANQLRGRRYVPTPDDKRTTASYVEKSAEIEIRKDREMTSKKKPPGLWNPGG
jgi:hypothetical protein